jgi:hypothetical protein
MTNPPPPPYAPQPEMKPFIDDSAGMALLIPIRVSTLALIAGYLGLFAGILVPAPLALLVGVAAVLDLRRHPGKRGMGRAIFGVFMGTVGTAGLVYMLMK